MLRTGTGLPIPEELLHSGEVARGPQPLAADGTRERLERDLGTTPVVHVARDAGQPQQHTSRPTIAAGKQIVEHRFRPLGESRRRRIRGRGVEVAGRSRVGEIALQQPHEIFGDLPIARLARRLAGREARPGDLHLILKQRAYRRPRPGDVAHGAPPGVHPPQQGVERRARAPDSSRVAHRHRGVQDRSDHICVAIGEHGPVGRTPDVAGEPAGHVARLLAIARLPRGRPRNDEIAQQAGAYQLRRLVPRARRESGIAGIDQVVEHRPGGCEVCGVAGARIHGEEQVDGLLLAVYARTGDSAYLAPARAVLDYLVDSGDAGLAASARDEPPELVRAGLLRDLVLAWSATGESRYREEARDVARRLTSDVGRTADRTVFADRDA